MATRSSKVFLVLGLVLTMLLGADVLAQAPKSMPAPINVDGKAAIAGVVYQVGERTRKLELLRLNLPKVDDIGLIQFLRTHPSRTSFPNLAFALVDNELGAGAPSAVLRWISYAYLDRRVVPQQALSASLAWASDTRVAYVVLCRSLGWAVDLRVFRVDVGRELGVLPLRLGPENFDGWPREGVPHFEARHSLPGRDISGVSAITATINGSTLAVLGQREDLSSPDVVFRLDFHTGQWATPEAQVAAERPADGKRR